MILNVGGFGHTGNTALLDFLIDTGYFSPLAKDFGESSILRGNWCLWGMLKALKAGYSDVPNQFYKDAFLGSIKEEHQGNNPPDINDFKRNARVLQLLGSSYKKLVDSLVDQFNFALEKGMNERDFTESTIRPFYHELTSLAKEASPLEVDGYVLSRNDPAGYAISLLDTIEFSSHVSIIRSPLDVAFEWCHFYHKIVDEPTIRKFSTQFCKKIDRFSREYDGLSKESRDRVVLIAFEDIVSSEAVRTKLCKRLTIGNPGSTKRFDPKVSSKNVGVGDSMEEKIRSFVLSVCGKKYDNFKEKYQCLLVK